VQVFFNLASVSRNAAKYYIHPKSAFLVFKFTANQPLASDYLIKA